jgi:hypothetical protein
LELWREAVPIVGTVAEFYLRNVRGLVVPDGVSPHVLRFHPSCTFGADSLPCLVALFRDLKTDAPRAIHRIALTAEGQKVDRKALGPTRGAAIKLSPDDAVAAGLTIGEGLETTLSGLQFGLAPAWALGCAGAIAKFSPLNGIEALTILVDNDDAGRRAAAECSARWTAAECEVYRVVPRIIGEDLADIQRRRRA